MRPILRMMTYFVSLLPTVAAADDAIFGRVLGVDGRPSPGSLVAVAQEGRPLNLADVHLGPESPSTRAVADADGRFRMPRPGSRFALLAMDRGGVAIRTAEELAVSPDMALRPWGQVSGTVRLGARPDRDRVVAMSWVDGRLRVSDSREVQSDAQGHFTFDRVLPGLALLARKGPSFGGVTSDLRWVDVEPGQSPEVAIGGIGRPVVGRLQFPDDTPAPRFTGGRATLSRVLPPVPFPDESSSWSADRQLAWRIDWDRTPEGASHLRSQNRHVAPVAPDGTFRIEDVPPGRYSLATFLEHRMPEAPAESAPRLVAQGRLEIEVPPLPGGIDRSDDPLHLDPLAVTVAARAPEVGEQAPDFEIRTLDGESLRSRDLRGRYVLLDFWATWCVPCVEELPYLKATFEAFGGDPKFAIVGLSLDDRPEPARRYAEARGMRWTQGFLGDWGVSPVAASYDIQTIPSLWLIGPDGRVVARDLHGPAIRAAVAEALGRR